MMKIMQIILISFLLTSGCLQGGDEFRWSSKNCDRDAVSGVILSFDDIKNLESWYQSRELFLESEIKVTFYIDHPELLVDEKLEMLRVLASDGHEIGTHTMNHSGFDTFIESGGNIDSYISDEVIPALEILENLGFEVDSFSYPNGQRNSEIDEMLKPHFNTIRTTRSSDSSITSWKTGCEDGQVIMGSSIERMEESEVLDALDSAKDDEKSVLFYSHELSNSSKWDITEFRSLISEAQDRNLPFLLMNDLAK